jgi:hypothetical protein
MLEVLNIGISPRLHQEGHIGRLQAPESQVFDSEDYEWI